MRHQEKNQEILPRITGKTSVTHLVRLTDEEYNILKLLRSNAFGAYRRGALDTDEIHRAYLDNVFFRIETAVDSMGTPRGKKAKRKKERQLQ